MKEDLQLNVLLVDDNDIDVVVNTKLLRLANLTEHISAFSDGESAIQYMVDNMNDLKAHLNVLLLDIQMPGADGFKVLTDYQNLPDDFKSSCKVFMLSSSIDRNDIERAENIPDIIKVLEKPLDVYLLRRLIQD
ncbi:MAG: response regulator [Flavobacteriales bacterium]|nr:response regulator [Flavobacteriales bacterium]